MKIQIVTVPYDPAFDRDRKFFEAGLQSIRQIVSPSLSENAQ